MEIVRLELTILSWTRGSESWECKKPQNDYVELFGIHFDGI